MSEPTPEALSNARTWLVQPQDGSRDDRETPRLAYLFDRFAAAAVERERERCAKIVHGHTNHSSPGCNCADQIEAYILSGAQP